jgi:hypothetical protein
VAECLREAIGPDHSRHLVVRRTMFGNDAETPIGDPRLLGWRGEGALDMTTRALKLGLQISPPRMALIRAIRAKRPTESVEKHAPHPPASIVGSTGTRRPLFRFAPPDGD